MSLGLPDPELCIKGNLIVSGTGSAEPAGDRPDVLLKAVLAIHVDIFELWVAMECPACNTCTDRIKSCKDLSNVGRGLQVGVADLRPEPPFGRLRGRTAAPVSPPTTTAGDPPDLFHIQVHHMFLPPGPDPLGWAPQVLPGRGEITQPGDYQPDQSPARSAQADRHAALDQVAVDAQCPALVSVAQDLDELHHRFRGADVAGVWAERAIGEPGFS